MTVNAKSIQLLCMMQSGDIHPHPGPDEQNQGPTQKKKCRQPKFPCVSCSRGVTARSKAVSCNLCQNWTHIRCTGFITDSRYDKLVQEELELDFICNGCTNKEFPFSEEFDFYHSDKQTFSATKLPSSADPDHFQCFSRKGLHFLHINARSLLPKMSELRLIANKSCAAVISVTETWLDHSVSEGEITIDNYSVVRETETDVGEVFVST